MKKKAKIITIVMCFTAISLCATLGIAGAVFLGGGFNPRIGAERMEEIFVEDYEMLTMVVDYFIDSGHTEIRISRNTEKGFMFANLAGGNVSISDEYVITSVYVLRNHNYSVIGRSDNIIFFQRWSNLNGGRGIAFSIDGSEPSVGALMFLTRLEPLSKSNWFYWEEDVSEWRRRYQR